MALYNYNAQNNELKRIAGGTLYADLPIASEIEYAGSDVPTGFLEEDGSTYSATDYPDLYAKLGTTTLPNKNGYIIKALQIGAPADFVSAIDDVIEAKGTYSTTETDTGKVWIDGKKIYRKVVDIGTLPNNATKSVAHNIANIGDYCIVSGQVKSSGGTSFPIPHVESIASQDINVLMNATYVNIETYTNRSDLTGFVILEYTKN